MNRSSRARSTTHRAALALASLVASAWAGCTCGSVPPFASADAGVDAIVDQQSDDPISLLDAGDGGLSACEVARRTGDPLGCDYFVGELIAGDIGQSYACTVLFVSNPSPAPAVLELHWQGASYDLTKYGRIATGAGAALGYAPLTQATLAPDETAVIALVQGKWNPLFPREKCPFPSAIDGDVQVKWDSLGSAFELRSSVPVAVVYEPAYNVASQAPFTAAELRSTASWSRRYREVGHSLPDRPSYIDASESPAMTSPPYTLLLASEPTTVQLSRDGGLEDWFLDGGAVAFNRVQGDLFIGSEISATSPIGVAVGTNITRVPWNFDFHLNALEDGDLHQAAPPASWGHVYAAVRHPPRTLPDDEPALWRILADVDGTNLSYEPSMPPGAPSTLAAGKMGAFMATGPFVVRSQDSLHPIYVTQLMTSGGYGVCPTCDTRPGNAELVGVPPPEEYARRFAFFTDPSLPEAHVVVVRRNEGSGFADVMSDCAGKLSGWKPVGAGSEFDYVYVALSRGASGKFVPEVYPSGTCDNGAHWMKSDGPFALTVWGWSNPAGWPQPPNENTTNMSYGYTPFGLGPRPDRPQPN